MAPESIEGVSIRLHKAGSETVLALCDSELVGKTLVFEKTGAEFLVSGSFYGKEGEGPGLERAFADATSINILGKRALLLLGERGFSESDAIILSDENGESVPHITSVIIREGDS